MTFLNTLLVAMASIGAVMASPLAADESTVMLWNGTSLVPVTVQSTSLVDRGSLVERAAISCKGVRGCSTSQSFKDDCSNAYYKIEQTTYTQGGTSSGVCSGKCGIFVAANVKSAKGCKASGSQLSQAYNDIRSAGCQSCGSESNYGAYKYECRIEVNYVSGCSV